MANVGGIADVQAKLKAYGAAVARAAPQVVEYAAARTVVEGKRAAPWHDRTGNARRSIHYEAHHSASVASVTIGIGVKYGVYLELSHGGKYRVIDPVVFGFGKSAFTESLKLLGNVG